MITRTATTLIGLLLFLFAATGSWALEKNYEYDAADRLIRCRYDNGVVVEYTYDTQGNRTSKRVTGFLSASAESLTTSVLIVPIGSTPVLRFALSNASPEVLSVMSATVSCSGSLQDQNDFTAVKLFLDANDNGVVDAGDTQLGASTVFSADDGIATFDSLGFPLSPGAAEHFLVVVTPSASAQPGKTFQVSLNDGDSVVAQGQSSGWTVFPLGVPVSGPLMTTEFTTVQYTLTYAAGTNGSIAGISPQTVSYGGNGTAIAATADPGYHFVNWSDGRTDNPRTDTNVTGDINVTAFFTLNGTYLLTYIAGHGGTIEGTNPQTVVGGLDGEPVSAVADVGHYFVDWSDLRTDNPRTDTTVTTHRIVTANFAHYTRTITFQTDGTPGATLIGEVSQTVNYGADCTVVTAYAPMGYLFLKWTKDGADYSTDRALTITNVTEPMTLTAHFVMAKASEAWNEWILYE